MASLGLLYLRDQDRYDTNVLELWNFYEVGIKNIIGSC
jgi:hypothetical protein